MPSDVPGLAVLVIFVLPGLVYLLRRRALVPQRVSSAFVEIASLVAVSTFTNLAALGAFALLRSIRPSNTPNVGEMMRSPTGYVIDRPGYVLAWTIALVALSSLLALLWANEWGPVGWFARRYAPTIVPASAWYWIDQSAPEGSLLHVGCDMADGVFVSGYLAWYNSDPSESGDRELVLSGEMELINGEQPQRLSCGSVVVASRDIRRMYITYVDAVVDVESMLES